MKTLYTKRIESLFFTVILFFLLIALPLDAIASSNTDVYAEQQILQTIRKHPEAIVEAFQLYNQQQEKHQDQLLKDFSQALKLNPVETLGNSPRIGLTDSEIILVEFSDFQCPYCLEFYRTLKKFSTDHTRQVSIVYKHLPIESIHPEALSAAKAAWSAGRQGKFWDYHDALFEQQKDLSESLYIKIAKSLNLDISKFNNDRISSEASSAIQKDINLARKLKVSGTPFFVMGTEYVSGAVSLSKLEEVFNRASLGQFKSEVQHLEPEGQ